MANEEQLENILKGAAAWNDWREKHPDSPDPDLSGALLSGANLSGAKLFRANLRAADLSGANLHEADLRMADLTRADLSEANLSEANLSLADLCLSKLRDACLVRAILRQADLRGADLSGADLCESQLNSTDFRGATLTGSYVYGASVWDIKVDNRTKQQNLIITEVDESDITVDNIQVAQFIYLLLNNQEIRNVIDTITSKAVLILGRFSEERKPVLDALRHELRKPEHNYIPIMFDFPPSANQTTIETIKTLANMCRFVVADLTDARSVLMELGIIVPTLPSVAVRLLIKKSEHEYGMLDFIRKFASVVKDTFQYENEQEVITSIKENIIVPAEAKVRELRQRD